MNNRLRQRTIKNFIASVLMSDLSEMEIDEIAKELMRGDLGREIGEILKEMVMISAKSFDLNQHINRSDPSVHAYEAYEIAKRRRLSKKALSNLMVTASPHLPKRFYASEMPLKDFLERYFEIVPVSEAAFFLNILNGEPSDPYLKGIVSRNRG